MNNCTARMTHLSLTKDFIVIGTKTETRAYTCAAGECVFKYKHEFDKDAKDGNSQAVNQKIEDVAVSDVAGYMCALFSDKKLVVWDSRHDWRTVAKTTTNRRATAVTFGHAGDCLYVADKSGDLYKYDIAKLSVETGDGDAKQNDESGPQPILGHVSMLLDVSLTNSNRYLLTADRDEKIRISALENPFLIQSFCLGHTDFVCATCPLKTKDEKCDVFVSASGDCTLRVWDAGAGSELFCHSFVQSKITKETANCGDGELSGFIPSLLAETPTGGMIAVASQQKRKHQIHIFKFDAETKALIPHGTVVPSCENVAGIAFLPAESRALLILGRNEHDKLEISMASCTDDQFQVVDSDVAVAVSEHLADLSVEYCDVHQGLVKASHIEPYDGATESTKQKQQRKKKLATSGGDHGQKAKRPKWVSRSKGTADAT